MATLPGGQTVGANQVNLGTATAPNIQNINTPTVDYSNQRIGVTNPSLLPSPTSVVGTNLAAKQASMMQTTVNNQSNINTTAANTPSPTNDVRDSNGLLMNPPGALFDRNTGASLNQSTNTGPTTSTPEEKIANAPDEGMQEAYNLKTGQREDQPIGALQSGYSAHNPTTRTDVSNSVSDNNGVTYKQFSDGTYGRIDQSGNYSQATPQSFQAAQAASDVQKKILAIQNGTFQLPPNQQAQLDGLSAKYSGLMLQQATENANVTGATTLAENLYGMGNSLSGQGEITKTVNDGIQKIQTLQFELANGLAVMMNAFQKDDLSQLKDTYDSYEKNQDSIQNEIDKQTTYLQTQQDKLDNQSAVDAQTLNNKYGDMAGIITPNMTAQQKHDMLMTSPSYTTTINAKAGMNQDQQKFWAQLSLVPGANINLPSRMSVADKQAIMQTIADNAAKIGMTGTDVGAMLVDKGAKAKAYSQLQTQGAQLVTQESKVEKDFKLAEAAGKEVSQQSWEKVGIPALQNFIRTGTLQATNDQALNRWLGLTTTSLTNYARVVFGQTGQAAVTQGANDEIQKILQPGSSPEAVSNYMEKAAIPEMKNTIAGFNSSMSQLMDNINVADGTTSSTNTTGGLGISSSGSDTSSSNSGGFAESW